MATSSDSGVNQPFIMVSFNTKKSRLDKPEFSSETTGEIGLEPDVSFPKEQDMLCLPSVMPHSIQKQWFAEDSWLNMCDDRKSLYCIICHWAFENRRIQHSDITNCSNNPWKNKFSGFSTFKKGKAGRDKHVNSGIHKTAKYAMNSAKHAAQHKVMLHESANAEFELARTGLKAIFEVVRLCGHQCIPMRSHRDEDVTSNFNCIVNVIAKFNPQVKKYLESDLKQKFLSPQIQNEILKDLAHALLRILIARIRTESVGLSKEPVFSIIIDETTDINRIEQVAICVRFCNKDMESEEVFIGFHQTSRTDANTMLKLVNDSLLTFGLPFSGIRGQGYDGASNVSGRENGLQAKVLTENPKALYLYCFGHQLNLVVQDSLKAIPEVSIALERMHAVVQFIKNQSCIPIFRSVYLISTKR